MGLRTIVKHSNLDDGDYQHFDSTIASGQSYRLRFFSELHLSLCESDKGNHQEQLQKKISDGHKKTHFPTNEIKSSNESEIEEQTTENNEHDIAIVNADDSMRDMDNEWNTLYKNETRNNSEREISVENKEMIEKAYLIKVIIY